ncbi:hypothetical protein JKO41_000238 [Neisseria gonorrhoeae]|nr:hypothetical protein [Neisseria gonorrhoeae]MCR8672237.1 hypothetical protein [Neisseria gonorrhoeae]MCS0585651.1 hypothetical protein [Neisseria gonorrhoeae]MCS0592890.1 hypothetical protein [Neisseria gonorrhoeae]MCS0617197.1 hypothetical protein [Neisseria gonorrhoeae]MCS0619201.1 hypothetical protein [Neisseria gonorrhoeae]
MPSELFRRHFCCFWQDLSIIFLEDIVFSQIDHDSAASKALACAN